MNETPWSDDDAAKMKSYEALSESMSRLLEHSGMLKMIIYVMRVNVF